MLAGASYRTVGLGDGASDAMIVSGLIAVLRKLYNGLPAREVGPLHNTRRLSKSSMKILLNARQRTSYGFIMLDGSSH